MRNVKVVKTMKNDQVIDILKNNAEEHLNDSRQIVKHKNNSLNGNQLGVVLSNIDNTTFEVFIHSKINGEVISQIVMIFYFPRKSINLKDYSMFL